jgi:hypothetical protein
MPATSAESSLLLAALGILVAFMTAHVFMGWIRVSQHHEGWRRWGALGVAALVFGTGFSIALSIGLLGEALAFPIGFRRLWVVGLWLAGVALAVPIAAWPSFRPGTLTSIGVGALLAAVVVGIQVGLLSSVGFRPGLRLRNEFVALGWLTMSVGFAAAVTLALPSRALRHRHESWRYAGSAVMGVATLAGEALVVTGTNLTTQVGSIYRSELSASMLSLIGGALLPMVLAMMMVDLELRRRQWRSERRRRRHLRHRSPGPREPLAEGHPPAAASQAGESMPGVRA